ncbi:MAG TPA: hypothetical protein VGY66_03840 [Gemmataceae bacterium]|nr:hypothetical protein [Gemmataceae bacterium]
MAVRAAQLIIERAHGQPPTREETRLILDDGKNGGDKIEVVFVTPKPQPDDDWDYKRVVH